MDDAAEGMIEYLVLNFWINFKKEAPIQLWKSFHVAELELVLEKAIN